MPRGVRARSTVVRVLRCFQSREALEIQKLVPFARPPRVSFILAFPFATVVTRLDPPFSVSSSAFVFLAFLHFLRARSAGPSSSRIAETRAERITFNARAAKVEKGGERLEARRAAKFGKVA